MRQLLFDFRWFRYCIVTEVFGFLAIFFFNFNLEIIGTMFLLSVANLNIVFSLKKEKKEKDSISTFLMMNCLATSLCLVFCLTHTIGLLILKQM